MKGCLREKVDADNGRTAFLSATSKAAQLRLGLSNHGWWWCSLASPHVLWTQDGSLCPIPESGLTDHTSRRWRWCFKHDILLVSALWLMCNEGKSPTIQSFCICPFSCLICWTGLETNLQFHKCQKTGKIWAHFVLLNHTKGSCPGLTPWIFPPTEPHHSFNI